jgi:hypothetical protein
MDEGMRISHFSISDMSTDLLYAIKSYDMGPLALLPTQRKMWCRFLPPLKIHRLGQVWTRDPWMQWQAHWPLRQLALDLVHLLHSDCEHGCTVVYLYEGKTNGCGSLFKGGECERHWNSQALVCMLGTEDEQINEMKWNEMKWNEMLSMEIIVTLAEYTWLD